MEENKDWKFHSCKLCSYRTKSSFVLSKHESFHETRLRTDVFTCDLKSPEMYECEFCDFETGLKVDLTEHFRVFHEGKAEDKEMKNFRKCYRCKKCDFETHSVLVLTNHTDDECNTHKLNEPENPHKGSTKTNILLEHSYSRTGHFIVQKWFKCVQCRFQSKHMSCVKQHYEHSHASPDVNWFQCAQCEYKSKWKNNLKQHILQRHTILAFSNRSEYKQYGFKRNLEVNLDQHILARHTNPQHINLFQCGHCAYKSIHKNNFKRHVKNQHGDPADLKWFHCGQCDYKSLWKNNIKKHFLRIHADPTTVY